jgi:hypothetical protein
MNSPQNVKIEHHHHVDKHEDEEFRPTTQPFPKPFNSQRLFFFLFHSIILG